MRYCDLTPERVRTAVRAIVARSTSDDEIKRLVAEELNCPYAGSMAITSHMPTDHVGRQARSIVAGLGGLIRKDGAMVMIMMHGPDGKTLSV